MKHLFRSSSHHDEPPPSYPAAESSSSNNNNNHNNGGSLSGNSQVPVPLSAKPAAVVASEPFYPPLEGTFACVQLARRDRIRLIGFPQVAIPAVGEAIRRVWVTGIQSETPQDQGTYEWKLSGNPWAGYGHEAIPSRRLIIHILHALAAIGWHLHHSSDLSKKGYDKDTLFFRSGLPVQKYFCAISFNESDKIRMIDSPNDAVLQAFKGVIGSWQAGVQDGKWKEEGCWQFKLRGNPWYTSVGHEINYGRLVLCQLLGAMEGQGYELVASVDMSVATENVGDLDTWFFANKR